MRKYLEAYLEYITGELNKSVREKSAEELKREHLVQISFMQHERLVHLIVTCLFAFIVMTSLGLFCVTGQIGFGLLTVLAAALVVPYIRHYYFLENSVQKMYGIYNSLVELSEEKKSKEYKADFHCENGISTKEALSGMENE